MSITKTLFPPANREAAAVAFLRTFWQTVRAVGSLSIVGGIVVTANQLATINWTEFGYTAGAVVLSGILAGALAGGDVLTKGLPDAYIASLNPAVPVSAPVPAPIVDPTVPVVGE